MEGMSEAEWKRKYVDTHKGLSAIGQMMDGKHITIKEPSDLNARNVKHLKKPIEKKCHKDRSKDLQHFVMDTVAVRAEDMLDRKQLPAKDLLKIAVSTIDKTLNVEQNVNHTFSSLWDDVDITQVEKAEEVDE